MSWNSSTLGNVCDLINRGIAPSYVEDGGILVLNQKCIRNHNVNYELSRRHDSLKKPVKEERLIRAGDVLVNSTGTGTLGRVALVLREPSEPTTVDTHITIVRPKKGMFDKSFFGLMLISIEEKIKQAGEGSVGQTELSRVKLRDEFVVSYPSDISVQKKIADKLNAIFAEIDKATAATEANAENAEALWQSVIDKVTSDFHNRESIVSLSEVVKIVSKLVDPKEDKFQEFLHIGAGNIISNTGELCDLKTAKEENLISGKFIFDCDTVLYSKIRPYLKKVTKPNFIGLCSADVYPLVCVDGKLTKDFLFYLLLSSDFTNYAISGSERAGMPKVNREHLFAYEFNLPSVPEQESLTKKINAVYDLNESMNKSFRKKIQDLSCLKQSILRKAFTGQLVKE